MDSGLAAARRPGMTLRRERDHSVRVDFTFEPTRRSQRIEMRQCLAKSLARVLHQYARKDLLHDRERMGLLGDERRHVVEPRLVMLAQLPQARVQGAEWQAVR